MITSMVQYSHMALWTGLPRTQTKSHCSVHCVNVPPINTLINIKILVASTTIMQTILDGVYLFIGPHERCPQLRISMRSTYIDQVGSEPLLQVGQEGVLARVVLHEHEVLHADVIACVQLAFHAFTKRLSLAHPLPVPLQRLLQQS